LNKLITKVPINNVYINAKVIFVLFLNFIINLDLRIDIIKQAKMVILISLGVARVLQYFRYGMKLAKNNPLLMFLMALVVIMRVILPF